MSEEMEENLELHRRLNLTPSMLSVTEPDGRYTWVNDVVLQYFGLSAAEITSGDLRIRVVFPDDFERLREERRRGLASGAPFEYENRLRRRDGQYRWFLVRFQPLKDEAGRVVRWYGSATDIEDRKRAELRLRRSEAYLAEAQRLSHTGSWATNPVTGEIKYLSEELLRILGIDPQRRHLPDVEEFFSQIVHPDDRDRFREVWERACREKAEFSWGYRAMQADRTERHIHTIGHPVLDETGELIEFVGTAVDVTERKQAEAEQLTLKARLQQAEKMEAIGRFASGIAHDFNSVLGGILAFAEMLFDEAPENAPSKRYAQNVLTAATRGRDLIDQILMYTRSERGKRVPTDVCSTVAETLELVRSSLPAGITLCPKIPDAPLVIMGDATRLHQVVMNLCSNAIHAMKAGGPLHVGIAPMEVDAERALSHGALRPGGYVCVSVEDSGCGMDETIIGRIFEPFFTTKEVGHGTGLGLALAYAIVADFGGSIDVKSLPGEGSTFSIYIPMAEASNAAVTSP